MKNRFHPSALALVIISAALLVLYVLGLGFLFSRGQEHLSNATDGEKRFLSTVIDPTKAPYENVIASQQYSTLGTVTTADGLLLYAPGDSTELAPLAFYNLVGEPSITADHYISSTYEDLCRPERWSPWTGLKGSHPSLTLTVSSKIQETLFAEMSDHGITGICFAYDILTGEVLTQVSTPGSTPETENPPMGSLINQCLSDISPGSILKPLTLLLAARQDIDITSLSYSCTSSYILPDGNPINCTGYHGVQNSIQALGTSCNCFFAQLIETMDLVQAAADLRELGFSVNGEPVCRTLLAGSNDPIDLLGRGSSSITLHQIHDFSTVWSLVGETSPTVSPIEFTWLIGSIAAGKPVPFPHLSADTQASPLPLFPEKTKKDTALETVSFLWHEAYETHYGDEYHPRITVAKTGTTEDNKGNLSKRLVGLIDDRVAFFITIENYRTGTSQLNVLPVHIANLLASLVCQENR